MLFDPLCDPGYYAFVVLQFSARRGRSDEALQGEPVLACGDNFIQGSLDRIAVHVVEALGVHRVW